MLVFLKDVVFYFKDMLKVKSRPLADRGRHVGTNVLELLKAHFSNFVNNSLQDRPVLRVLCLRSYLTALSSLAIRIYP